MVCGTCAFCKPFMPLVSICKLGDDLIDDIVDVRGVCQFSEDEFMKKIDNWNEVQANGEFEKLEAGGYVIRITEVKDVADKEYLEIIYDIAEGPEKDRYADDWGAEHPYAHRFIRSYKEKAVGMFKQFTNAIEASNDGYTWNFKESTLKGKIVGVVIAYEQYRATNGNVSERTYIKTVKPAQDIRDGKFTIPDLKRIKEDDGIVPIAAGDYDPFAGLDGTTPF